MSRSRPFADRTVPGGFSVGHRRRPRSRVGRPTPGGPDDDRLSGERDAGIAARTHYHGEKTVRERRGVCSSTPSRGSPCNHGRLLNFLSFPAFVSSFYFFRSYSRFSNRSAANRFIKNVETKKVYTHSARTRGSKNPFFLLTQF